MENIIAKHPGSHNALCLRASILDLKEEEKKTVVGITAEVELWPVTEANAIGFGCDKEQCICTTAAQ